MPRPSGNRPARRPGVRARPAHSGRSAAAAGGLVVLQGLLVAVLSVVLAVSGFRPGTVDRAGAEILAAIGLASAVALGVLGRGVGGRRRWARAPVLVLELICLPVAFTVVQSGRWYAGVPLGVSALGVLVLLALSGQLGASER